MSKTRLRGGALVLGLAVAGAGALGWGLAGCTCGTTGTSTDSGGPPPGTDSGGVPGYDSAALNTDAAPPPGNVFVYAHTSSTLYAVDPDLLTVTPIGPFMWPSTSDEMTDIAIDATGYMVGISYTDVYAVDKETAACTHLSMLDTLFNGLSFVPADTFEPGGQEILVAAALDGSLYEVDPMTGASTSLGNYGGGWGSSGDVVSVLDLGTLATVTDDQLGLFGNTDRLGWVDPSSGAVTIIGDTGVTDIWGLAYWGDRAFGFTENGQFVTLDVDTGYATVVDASGIPWWGASVTTMAYVIQ